MAPTLKQIIGGQEVQASILMARWAGDDAVRATFVSTTAELPALIDWVRNVPYLRTIVRFPKYLLTLEYSIRNTDVVHAFSGSFSSFLLATLPAWMVSRLHNKPILINYRSGRAGQHLARSRIARSVLRRCALVVPSSYLVQVFGDYGIEASVILNVIDSVQFKYRTRASFRPLLICSRNMEPHYRIDVVIRAFAKVQSAYPEARLALVGTGTCERENRDLASRLQLAQIDFKGRMPPSAMPRLYDENDIFINGSSVDNAPSSIIEAFSSGLAVASTDCGGISHLIQHEHTGLLSANGDWNALADNVIRILRDQVLARKMAENARIAAQRHEWRVVRRDWLALYEALIGFI